MMIVGLTGSIGMGKSTTAAMFKECGILVYDADQAVHDLYENEAVAPIGALFPQAIQDGRVDRTILSKFVLNDPKALKSLEQIVHPLVRQCEQDFIAQARQQNSDIVILDIPLLFETGGDQRVDKIIVVTAPADVQKQRILERANMDEKKLQSILEKQMPDAQKRARADYIIDTSYGLEQARQQVRDVIADLLNLNKEKCD